MGWGSDLASMIMGAPTEAQERKQEASKLQELQRADVESRIESRKGPKQPTPQEIGAHINEMKAMNIDASLSSQGWKYTPMKPEKPLFTPAQRVTQLGGAIREEKEELKSFKPGALPLARPEVGREEALPSAAAGLIPGPFPAISGAIRRFRGRPKPFAQARETLGLAETSTRAETEEAIKFQIEEFMKEGSTSEMMKIRDVLETDMGLSANQVNRFVKHALLIAKRIRPAKKRIKRLKAAKEELTGLGRY